MKIQFGIFVDKKTRPLEDTIEFYFTFNLNHKLSKADNQKELNGFIQTFQEACENLINIVSMIKKEAIQTFESHILLIIKISFDI